MLFLPFLFVPLSISLSQQAHWCPPCRGYTPELVTTYNALKAANKNMESIFVSSDRDEASFNSYYSEMPWLALPYSERAAKNDLSNLFSVEGIPSLVVLGPVGSDGKRPIINPDARGSVDPSTVSDFPFPLKPISDLSKTADCNGSSINDAPSVVLFCEGCDDDEQKDAVEQLTKVAEAMNSKGGEKILFYYAKETGGVGAQVRKLCKLTSVGSDCVMVKLDINDGGAYYVSDEKNITAANIEKFIANSGVRKQLERG